MCNLFFFLNLSDSVFAHAAELSVTCEVRMFHRRYVSGSLASMHTVSALLTITVINMYDEKSQ